MSAMFIATINNKNYQVHKIHKSLFNSFIGLFSNSRYEYQLTLYKPGVSPTRFDYDPLYQTEKVRQELLWQLRDELDASDVDLYLYSYKTQY